MSKALVFGLLDTFGFFDTFVTQNLFFKLGFIGFLHSMGPNLLQKNKKTYRWNFKNFYVRLTDGSFLEILAAPLSIY